jgi:hypothetical protein
MVGFYKAMNANLNFRYDEIVHTMMALARIFLAVEGVDEVRAQIKEREWGRAVRGALVLLRYYPRGLLGLLNERRNLAVRLRARQQMLRYRKRQLRLHERRLQALYEQPGHREQQRRVEELEGALAEERREVQRLEGRTQRLALRIRKLVYGEPLVGEVRTNVREREWGRALRGLPVLLRYHPRGLALLLLNERHWLTRRLLLRKQELEVHERRLEELESIQEPESALVKERQEVERLRMRIRRLERQVQNMDRRARTGRNGKIRKLLK